jgi:hypothetical protein
MNKLALVATVLTCAGCLSPGHTVPPDVPDHPVRRAINTTLLGSPSCIPSLFPAPGADNDVVGRALAGPGWVPDYTMRGCSSAEKCERFTFDFRCVKGAEDRGASGKGWLLPAADYPRITSALYRELLDAIDRAGGQVGHRRETGSTFEIEYTYGRVSGTVRGRIGPASDPYTKVEIDVGEAWTPK